MLLEEDGVVGTWAVVRGWNCWSKRRLNKYNQDRTGLSEGTRFEWSEESIERMMCTRGWQNTYERFGWIILVIQFTDKSNETKLVGLNKKNKI